MTNTGFHSNMAGTFCQNFVHLHHGKEMWLNTTINNTECLHHFILAGNWSKIFTPDALPINLILDRLVEHLEHCELIVQPDITGHKHIYHIVVVQVWQIVKQFIIDIDSHLTRTLFLSPFIITNAKEVT